MTRSHLRIRSRFLSLSPGSINPSEIRSYTWDCRQPMSAVYPISKRWDNRRKRALLLGILLLAGIAPVNPSDANSRPCLMVFVGGCEDSATKLMYNLRENVRNGNYPELQRCKAEYSGYDESRKIARYIQSFRRNWPRGSVTIIGHSLGGSTALSFAERGADHVVTLDAYYYLANCSSVRARIQDIRERLRFISQPRKDPFPIRAIDPHTYWTYVLSKHPKRCRNDRGKKTTVELELAQQFGSGPIFEDDKELSRRPNESIFCKDCDHCDVEKMFEITRSKIWKRL